MFCVRQYIVCIRLVINGSLLHPFIPTNKNIIYVDLFKMIVLNVCASWADVLNNLGISLLCQFGILRICFVKFLLVFDSWLALKPFCIIYILAGFNHLCMVITWHLKRLGWRFPDIYLW